MAAEAPLILTLRLDGAHQARFDALREAHFPPERNHLFAHVTLFHALPGEQISALSARLTDVATTTPAPEVAVESLFSLGRGVAFRLVSPEVDALRRKLAQAWEPWLTPQDRSKGRLHVTVQNKVRPSDAKALQAELAFGFTPTRFASPGLDLWRYLGGPWDHAAAFEFAASGG